MHDSAEQVGGCRSSNTASRFRLASLAPFLRQRLPPFESIPKPHALMPTQRVFIPLWDLKVGQL